MGRNLDHGLVDEHGHGVEVAGVSLQTQPLRLQRDGSAAGKGIVQGGQLVWIEQLGGLRVVLVQLAHLPPRAANLSAGRLQHFLVGGVLPQHKVFDDFEQPLPLDGGLFLLHSISESAADVGAGIIDQLRKDHRPRRRQRSPRPPQVQCAGMSMPDGFLPRTSRIDRIQGQGDLNEFAGGFDGIVGHEGNLGGQFNPSLVGNFEGEAPKVHGAFAHGFDVCSDSAIRRFELEDRLVGFHGQGHQTAVMF